MSDEITPERLRQSALEQGWLWDEERQRPLRPGLLGKLDQRMEKVIRTSEIEGASVAQMGTWMTNAMAEVIRDASAEDFEASHAWLNRWRR